ncbi:hypothetical protein [Paracidovorax citrulli]|uniref:hypothetical protein n=1 Tax=Paracidovorax citrulli TaxID=80869 RepID=UPI003FA6CE25
MPDSPHTHVHVRDRCSAALKPFEGSMVSIFKTRADNTPYHYGTAFGIEIDGESYLVTAAHVLDRDPNNESDEHGVGLVFSGGRLVNLSPYDLIRLQLDGQPIDLVAVQPESINLRDVFTRFLTKADVFYDRLTTTHYLAACGFPEAKSRQGSRAAVLAGRRYSYFGKCSDESKRLSLELPEAHFRMDFNVKWTFRSGFGGFIAPDPRGISGGPVFVVHDLANPNQALQPRIAGVSIETRKKLKCFVSVNIRCLIDALENQKKNNR